MRLYVIRYADSDLTDEDLEATAKSLDRPGLFADTAGLLGVGPETPVGTARPALVLGRPTVVAHETSLGGQPVVRENVQVMTFTTTGPDPTANPGSPATGQRTIIVTPPTPPPAPPK